MAEAPATEQVRETPEARPRRLPVVVGVVTALWGALLLGASLVWPVGLGYDEPQHFDMAYVYSASPFTFYGPGQLPATSSSIAIQARLGTQLPPKLRLSQLPIEPRASRPTLAELGGTSSPPGAQPNYMVQHPPLYYWLGALVLKAPGVSSLAYDVQFWLVRLLSVVLALPVPALCWAAARRLVSVPAARGATLDGAAPPDPSYPAPLRRLVPLTALVLPLTIPNLVRDASSVSNDSLLLLSVSVLCWALARVVTGDLTRRTALWVAVSLAVGLWTKGFALVLPPVVLAAYLVGGWRVRSTDSRRGTVRAVVVPLLVAACGGAVGAVWWVRNLVVYGTVQTNGLGDAYQLKVLGPPDFQGRPSQFFPEFLSQFGTRFYGGVGLADNPSMGPLLTWGPLTLLVVGVLAALLVRGRPGDRVTGAVLLSSVVLTLGLTTYGALSAYEKWGNVNGAQGRYIYHLVVVIAALFAVGVARLLRPQVLPAVLPVVFGTALVINVLAWVFVLQQWYASPTRSLLSTFLAAAHSFDRWSPLPPSASALVVVVLPVVTAALAALPVLREWLLARSAVAALADPRSPATPPTPTSG